MASGCSCDEKKKKQHKDIQLQNPHLSGIKVDFLYHIALDTETVNLIEAFGDTKFVCMGGSAKRMAMFADYIKEVIGSKLPFGSKLMDISESADRYSLYKIGPVISVSHGMGCPSISILLNELIKLMRYAKCKDPVFFRLGTCGGIGHEGGTVIISEDACDGMLKRSLTIPILGKLVSRPSELDKKLCDELKSLVLPEDEFEVVSGTTLCANDFYEGQARLDGAFCAYKEEDKLNFLKHLQFQGITNIEMESTAFAALTKAAGIRAAVVCVSLLDRLNGDQINASKDVMMDWQTRPQSLISRYIKKHLGI